MKRFIITSILAAIAATGTMMMAQDQMDEYLGLPGDNLNLYAVMKLFQESETLEGFERSLNDENTRINNLDLNNDNLIDYIKVIDYPDGDVHTIVLQAVLGRNESQDVAVFTVEKLRDGSVQIQLTGDAALYGNKYIIEPIYDETPNPGYTGRANYQNVTVVRTSYVEVAAWPVVRFIYLPGYTVWHSSWYWGYYPYYWHSWTPFYYHYYYGYHYNWYSHYYAHYHHCNYHRYAHWENNYYNTRRVYSRNVSININSGNFRTTYSHPEQRRDGETLYAKSHPERVASMSVNNNRRQTDQTASAGGRSNGNVNSNSAANHSTGQTTGNSRRSEGNSAGRSAGNEYAGRDNNGQGGSNGNVNSNSRGNSSTDKNNGKHSNAGNSANNNKPQTGSQGHQNNGAVPRSTTTTNNRANTGSTASQSTVTNNTNRRSSEASSPKPSSKPQKNNNSAKPSGQSQNNGNNSGGNSSSNNGSKSKNSGSSEKKSNSNNNNNGDKNTDNGNSSRRK